MAFNQARLVEVLRQYPDNGRLLLAFSGGLDSHVLLHALVASAKLHKRTVSAIYINHGLQSQSSDWQDFCQQCCIRYQIPFHAVQLSLDLSNSESVEAVARDARYQAISGFIENNDILLTAQHADDQAETFLVQLLRSAGVYGLAAMPAMQTYAKGYHARPLLAFSRADLEQYAKHHQLEWVEDPSNQDVRFTRNAIRHQLLPVAKQIQPSVVKTLNTVASNMGKTKEAFDFLLAEKLSSIIEGESIRLTELQVLPLVLRESLLRYWIKTCGFRTPPQKRLLVFIQQIEQAADDKLPSLYWDNVSLRCWKKSLFLFKEKVVSKQLSLDWASDQSVITLPTGIGQLNKVSARQGIDRQLIRNLTIRFRQGGEKLLLPGKDHQLSLKQFFQDENIPPWERSLIPLIYINDELAAVADKVIAKKFFVKHGNAFQIKWIKP